MRGPSTAIAAILFLGMTLLLSAPLALHLGDAAVDPGGVDASWSRADYDLTAWILAWGAHALAADPTALFDGNLFHPAENTLAGSENLLGLQPLAAPIFLLTGNAVLTQNLTLLLLVALSGFTTFLAVRGFTGNPVAGLAAGILFAFAPQTTGGWVKIHWAAVSLLPAITWLAFAAAEEPSRRRLGSLGVMVLVQIAAGIYVAYALAAWLLALAPGLLRTAVRSGRSPVPVYAAILAGGLASLPLALPYLRHGVEIDPDALAIILAATSPGLGDLAQRLFEQLGGIGLALAALGVLTAFLPRPARMPAPALRLSLLAAASLGFVLAAGVHLPTFHAFLREWAPGFGSIRGPVRFFTLTLLATSLLAGIGTAELARRAARLSPRAGPALAWAAAAFALLHALLEPGAAAHALRPLPQDSDENAAYHWLAANGDARALVELPAHRSVMEPAALAATGRAMRGATLHWQPLVGGYTGHPPANASLLAALAARLPSARAFADLCAFTELGWILVRPTEMSPAAREAWQKPALPVALAAAFDTTRLYRVEQACGPHVETLRSELRGERPGTTLHGIPLEDAGEVRAELNAAIPPQIFAGIQQWVTVDIRNLGERTWPGLSTQPDGRLGLQTRWRIAGRAEPQYNDAITPLGTDLAPGETVRLEVGAFAPLSDRPVLEIGLVREGSGWIADGTPGSGALVRIPVATTPLPAGNR